MSWMNNLLTSPAVAILFTVSTPEVRHEQTGKQDGIRQKTAVNK